MPGPERSFAQQKTCPNPDKGSRLANNSQPGLRPGERITLGALSARHPLGVMVDGSNNANFQHRITSREQILVPTTLKPARRPTFDGKGSRFGGTSKETRSKQRKKERKHLQRVKGYI